MKEFIEKLIERLEKTSEPIRPVGWSRKIEVVETKAVIDIVKQLAEEYNNDLCEWEYDEFETKWQADCGVLFALHDSDKEITHYCPCCGKKIKIAPYQPKGE